MLDCEQSVTCMNVSRLREVLDAILTCNSVDTVPLELKQQLLLAQGKLLQLKGLTGGHQLRCGCHTGIQGQVSPYLR